MQTRYFAGFLAVIAFIILVFVLIFAFTGRPSDQTGSTKTTELVDYAASTKTVRLTIDGVVKADSDHRSYQVTVGQNRSTMNVIGGYQGEVLNSKSYDNNQSSYRNFLFALQRAGFDKGDSKAKVGEVTGACPLGYRYTMEIRDGDDQLQQYWTTSCNGGNFKGNLNQVLTLFRWQIPDYDALIRGYSLN